MKISNYAMKIIVVYTFCLFFVNLSYAQAESNEVQSAINQFASSTGLENAAISFMAYDIENKSNIASHNGEMAIAPASIVKLFSTATAFETLGKDFQPKTVLYYDGEIDSNGILNGSIYIKGAGDPSLGSRFFYDRKQQSAFLKEWVAAIQSKGIKKITGRIIADGSKFGYDGAPDGWSWSDLGNYYGSGPSGCVVYDNMTYLHFSTSARLNDVTTLDSMTPHIEGYSLFNQVTTYNSSSDNCYVYGAPYSYDRFAIGNLPKNRTNFEVKASVPDPELLLAQEFDRALAADSILISNEPVGFRNLLLQGSSPIDYSGKKEVLSYEGKSISEVAFWTNMRSVNLFAEQLLCLVGANQIGDGRTSKSADYINSYWEPRLNIKMHQTDGSGLSRSNAFSANHFVKLMSYMHESKNFEAYKATIPVAGKSGTLTRVCRGQAADGRMYAKSGTMNRIKSYAGFVESTSGKKIAFALIVNNDDLSNYALLKKMETVFNVMARY
jgi:D-alanyl-D-alanine carboxypeptidase/D-alanyl-D-alanine-endopeptidase (penicillin-binding protein 4)